MNQELLQRSLEMTEVDIDDQEFFINTRVKVPDHYRLELTHMFQQRLFNDWYHSTSSSKLLVQWASPLAEPADGTLSLSVLCANLMPESSSMLYNGYYVSQSDGSVGGI